MLKDILKSGDKIFLVVQNFKSLINDSLAYDGRISEMKMNLQDYYKDFEITEQKGLILINDDNPLYNLSYVQSQLEPCSGTSEEQELLKLFREKFNFLLDKKSTKIISYLIRGEQ
jgi:hypothetical protein